MIDFYLFRSFAGDCKSVSCNAVWCWETWASLSRAAVCMSKYSAIHREERGLLAGLFGGAQGCSGLEQTHLESLHRLL